MDLLVLLNAFGLNATTVGIIGLSVVGLAAILAAAIPTPAPGSRWEAVRRVLDALAANVLHAENRTLADRLAVSMIAAGASLPGTTSANATAAPGGAVDLVQTGEAVSDLVDAGRALSRLVRPPGVGDGR